MKMKVRGWTNCPYKTDEMGWFSHTVDRIWVYHDNKKAVLEVFPTELYMAVTILKEDEDVLICEYVDTKIFGWNCDCRIFKDIDWTYMKYGFCKLYSWDMDTGKMYVDRFYFDRSLYLIKNKTVCPRGEMARRLWNNVWIRWNHWGYGWSPFRIFKKYENKGFPFPRQKIQYFYGRFRNDTSIS